MDRSPACVLALFLLLLIGGCRQSERRAIAVAPQFVQPPTSTTLTLSPEQLMSLDWEGRELGSPRVVDRRSVEGGVEFDIHFPSNEGGARMIDYTSSGSGGRRALVGIDVEPYKALALKFTLVSVTGEAGADLPQEVIVGALIGPAGDGRLSAYEPLVLGFSPDRAAGVATTPMNTRSVRRIGIHAEMANPEVWNAQGSTLTLRVEPAPGAGTLVPPAPVVYKKERPRRRPVYDPTFGPGGMKAW